MPLPALITLSTRTIYLAILIMVKLLCASAFHNSTLTINESVQHVYLYSASYSTNNPPIIPIAVYFNNKSTYVVFSLVTLDLRGLNVTYPFVLSNLSYCQGLQEGQPISIYFVDGKPYLLSGVNSSYTVGLPINYTVSEWSMAAVCVSGNLGPNASYVIKGLTAGSIALGNLTCYAGPEAYVKLLSFENYSRTLILPITYNLTRVINVSSIVVKLNGVISFSASFRGNFSTLPLSGVGGAAFPAGWIFTVTSAHLVAVVKSRVPVYLRYFTYSDYRGGALTYSFNVMPIAVQLPYTLTLFYGNTYGCLRFNVSAEFPANTTVVPIPEPVSANAPFYAVKNVTIYYTYPPAGLMLIEPGDVIISLNPIKYVNYSLTVCRVGLNEVNLTLNPYSLLYLNVGLPMSIKVPGVNVSRAPLTYVLNMVDDMLSKRGVLDEFRRFTNATWPPLLYTISAVYILRALGLPSRIAVGTVPVSSGGVYLEYGYLPWVEVYYNGWVGYKPYRGLPIGPGGNPLALFISSSFTYSSISLLMLLPALVIYYLYLYLTSRGG